MATAVANPGTVANDATVGSNAWTNPGNAATDNGANATCNISPGNQSNYLKFTNCGFAIPDGSTINGVSARIQAGNDASAFNYSIKLVKGGAIVGSERSNSHSWTPTVEWMTAVGGAADLWGTTLTVAEVNASDFGFVWSADTDDSCTLQVDVGEITVHYTAAGSKSRPIFQNRTWTRWYKRPSMR